jgi:hypothetical protein
MTALEELKFNLRESTYPYFTDDELNFMLEKYENDVDLTTYHAAILKAEVDETHLPNGLSIANSRDYFLSIAKKFRPNRTQALRRADDVIL